MRSETWEGFDWLCKSFSIKLMNNADTQAHPPKLQAYLKQTYEQLTLCIMAIFQDDENGTLNQSRHWIRHLFTGQPVVSINWPIKLLCNTKNSFSLNIGCCNFKFVNIQKIIFSKIMISFNMVTISYRCLKLKGQISHWKWLQEETFLVCE